MSSVNPALRIGVIRARKLEAAQLIVRRGALPRQRCYVSKELVQKLRRELRKLRHSLHNAEHDLRELRHEVHHNEREVEAQIRDLQQALLVLQAEVASGTPANSALDSLFVSKLGQVATVATSLETVVGAVTQVAANAVELTQKNGDIVIIPFARVTAVQ